MYIFFSQYRYPYENSNAGFVNMKRTLRTPREINKNGVLVFVNISKE